MIAQAFQDLGDKLTIALLGGDFASYRSLIALPVTMTPRNGATYVLEDEASLKSDFEQYHTILKLNGVTDIFRDVQSVTAQGPGRVEVLVTTHILQQANRVAEPFATRFFLRRDGADRTIIEIESSEEHMNWSLGRPVGGFGWV